MRNIVIIRTMLAMAAVPFLTGCVDFLDLGFHEPGTDIVFGVSDSWRNDVETRTEYSGKDQNDNNISSSSTFERIDWVAEKDRIRILCNAARNKSGANSKMADYVIYNVRMKNNDRKRSQANITSCDNNNLQWGTGWHYFYALYPAPGTVSNYNFTYKTASVNNSKIENVSGNKAEITGVIPATQEAMKSSNFNSDHIYKPNMNYAYMYAATRFNAGSSGNVPLSFEPLVTTLEFILSKTTTGLNSNLTKLELSSTSTALTGSFTASLDVTNGTPSVSISASSYSSSTNKITITLPNGGIALDNSKVHVTFLTLPVDQKDLKLTLTFANGALRTLYLKNINNGQVTACKKAYFDLTVPGSIPYTLNVEGPGTVAWNGGNATYKVQSYKQGNTGNEAVGWTAQYSTDGGSTWSNSKPSWLTSFTASDATGSTSLKSYTATLSQNRTAKTWGGSTDVAGSQYCPVNLGLTNGNLNTSNCYIVSQPGWYAIPIIYGNIYTNNTHGSSASYQVTGFVNHLGNAIGGAETGAGWIQNNPNLGFTYDYTNVTVELLWEDRNGLINTSKFDTFNEFVTQDQLNGGQNNAHNQLYFNAGFKGHSWAGRYFRFYVDPDYIGQGNAVIAVKYGGTIVWSWHIWVIESSKLGTKSASTGSVAGTVKIMNTPLGWYDADYTTSPRSVKVKVTQNVSGNTAVFTINQSEMPNQYGGNVFYQWGRKDPMLGMNGDWSRKTQYGGTPWTVAASQSSIANSISHPNVFYAGNHIWCSDTKNDKLWNTNGVENVDKVVTKSIYDPCPPGYKVPNRNAFHFTGYSGSFNRGYTLTPGSIFFPATFLLEYSSGYLSMDRVNGGGGYSAYIGGYYWTGCSNSASGWGGVYLEFSNAGTQHLYPEQTLGPIGYGFSVRCITE